MSEYDAIVIGAGAAGGIVAAVLAEAGKQVLFLERGGDLGDSDISRDQLRYRLKKLEEIAAVPG